MLWYVEDKLVLILAVVGYKMILLDQAEAQGVSCSLGVIPDRIRISVEVIHFFGVCHSCIKIVM